VSVKAGVPALALLALASTAAAAAPACPAPPDFAPRGRLESGDIVVLYRTAPPVIEIGQLFAVEAVICAGEGAGVTSLRMDARMPEHRHGMNYRPRVVARGDGRYVAEGLLFHMPGRWQLLFDVHRDRRTERLEADVVLE
jgi:hypothetical protein